MFHIKIIIKAILLIMSNTHMNSLSETTFSLSILRSMLILWPFLIETEEMLIDFLCGVIHFTHKLC